MTEPGSIDRIPLAHSVRYVDRAQYDALVDEGDRLRREGAALHARAEGIDKQMAALQKQVAAPVDRAAVLREAADAVLQASHGEPLRDAYSAYMRAVGLLRRMADETAATETQPRRGDQFETWLKQQRDDYASDRANDPATYDVLDDLLDQYRLHADTGTPLGEHVCEARVVGDCGCLEQPAAGARQDEAQR
ncbi:hypothetical protein [Streptomyces sp. NPDC058985]|uniref:hypothetical protein n=1 Tax=Streptomyces sp. NPDC058985 TaxID=3346684 RepID=UPI003685D7F6